MLFLSPLGKEFYRGKLYSRVKDGTLATSATELPADPCCLSQTCQDPQLHFWLLCRGAQPTLLGRDAHPTAMLSLLSSHGGSWLHFPPISLQPHYPHGQSWVTMSKARTHPVLYSDAPARGRHVPCSDHKGEFLYLKHVHKFFSSVSPLFLNKL